MKRNVHCLIIFVIALLVSIPSVNACTGITLKAEDGAVVFGRTMDWSMFEQEMGVVIIPRGQTFIGTTPDGKPGFKWVSKYGAVAIEISYLGKSGILDGLNEKGLSVGVFFHPGFAEYQEYDPKEAHRSIGSLDVIGLLLSKCDSISDVRKMLHEIRVVPIIEKMLKMATPLHYIVTEPNGKAVVIEYLDGELHIFNAPLGVITDSPNYDWHITNLRNYINLSPVPYSGKKMEGIDFLPLGGGSGLLGLPGDFTPPSRFVRAVTLSQTARSTKDGEETLYEVFRILDNFNVPLVSSEGSGQQKPPSGLRSGTNWTTASDTKNLVIYYHTQHNRRVRMIDLKKIDFTSHHEISRFPMDKEKRQDIKDMTP